MVDGEKNGGEQTNLVVTMQNALYPFPVSYQSSFHEIQD